MNKEWKYSNCGSPVKEIRSPIVQDDGSIKVVVTGKENLQDYINSNKESCNVEYLVSRAVNGDQTALNQRVGSYGDFTHLPKTYADMLQYMIDAQNVFDGLSKEVRAGFDNDVMKFIASVNDDDFLVRAGFVKPAMDESKGEEVNES